MYKELMVYVCSIMSSPIGCSSPGSSVHGTLQARTLVVLSLSKTLKILFPWAPKPLQMVTEAATKKTGVGCYFLLQGIFLTQGSNPRLLCLLHWQVDSLPLSHLGNPTKNSHNSATTTKITQLKMGREAEEMSKEDIEIANRSVRRSSTSLIIREMQTKTTMRCHLTPARMSIIKKARNNECQQGYGEKGTLVHFWWECKLVQPLWKTVWRFLRKLRIELS